MRIARFGFRSACGAALLATLPLGYVAWGAAPEIVSHAEMTIADHENLQRNLRWILDRERAEALRAAGKAKPERPRVGVFADAGCWHVGARSVVEALEGAGVPCRVLDRDLMQGAGLSGLSALVLPGGWAPFQVAALGERGVAVIKGFAEAGGRVVGICAGAYAMSRDVVWDNKRYPYPIVLFDGEAVGPMPGLAPWPGRSPVRLTVTGAGRSRGLAGLGARDLLYYGGAHFDQGTGVVVLATYPDGTAAVVSRRVGKGEVVLLGTHVERPVPSEGGDDAPPPATAGALLSALLFDAK